MGFLSKIAPIALPLLGGAVGGYSTGGNPMGMAAGANAGAGIASAMGVDASNNANRDLALGANAQNLAEAQRNRDFQAEMSNTAHQREIKDLKLAGLNPILSAGGGASTPSGSSGSAVTAQMQNAAPDFSSAVSSALDAKRLSKDVDQAEAQIKLVKQQEAQARAATKKTSAEAEIAQTTAKDTQNLFDARNGLTNANDPHSKYYDTKAALERSQMSTETKANNLESSKLDFDKSAQSFDNIMSRVGQAAGVINNATSALRPRISIGSPKSQPKLPSHYKVDKKTGEILND